MFHDRGGHQSSTDLVKKLQSLSEDMFFRDHYLLELEKCLGYLTNSLKLSTLFLTQQHQVFKLLGFGLDDLALFTSRIFIFYSGSLDLVFEFRDVCVFGLSQICGGL